MGTAATNYLLSEVIHLEWMRGIERDFALRVFELSMQKF